MSRPLFFLPPPVLALVLISRSSFPVEIIGYAGRIVCHFQPTTLSVFIVQAFFLLVPPSLFAASLYMVLVRTMTGLGPKAEALSIVRVSWMTKIFVLGDLFSFIIQSAGAAITASGVDLQNGSNIIIIGLLEQVLFFGFFVVASVAFHHRWTRTAECVDSCNGWRRMLYMLYGTSALILIRSVFRIIEYAQGFTGYAMINEWTLYVFDSVLMSAVMLVFLIWYPDEIQRYRQSNASGAESTYSSDKAEIFHKEEC
jgi:hypothetical protein